MDPKLTILFVLIGTIIAVSHFSEGKLDRMRQQLGAGRWREFMPGRRRS